MILRGYNVHVFVNLNQAKDYLKKNCIDVDGKHYCTRFKGWTVCGVLLDLFSVDIAMVL